MAHCRKCATEINPEAKNQYFCNLCNPWDRKQNRTWFSEAFDPEHRAEVAKEAKAKRFEGLKRKYSDVPLHWAVIQLYSREGKLRIRDIAKILETDEATISQELDIARQNAH